MRLSNDDTVAALKERRSSRSRRKRRMWDPNRVPLEHEEQANLIQWAFTMKQQIPELAMLFAIPNQGAARLKNLQTEGVMRGVPDLFLAIPRVIRCLPWHADDPSKDRFGLFVELKRRKGGKPSAQQYDWLQRLSAQGYEAIVCRGADEAREQILKYLGKQ